MMSSFLTNEFPKKIYFFAAFFVIPSLVCVYVEHVQLWKCIRMLDEGNYLMYREEPNPHLYSARLPPLRRSFFPCFLHLQRCLRTCGGRGWLYVVEPVILSTASSIKWWEKCRWTICVGLAVACMGMRKRDALFPPQLWGIITSTHSPAHPSCRSPAPQSNYIMAWILFGW